MVFALLFIPHTPPVTGKPLLEFQTNYHYQYSFFLALFKSIRLCRYLNHRKRFLTLPLKPLASTLHLFFLYNTFLNRIPFFTHHATDKKFVLVACVCVCVIISGLVGFIILIVRRFVFSYSAVAC